MKPLLLSTWLVACCMAWAQPDPQDFNTGRENHAGLVFTPDGQTAFWVAWDGKWGSSAAGPRTIYTAQLTASGWSTPRPAAFSGSHSDDDPFVSPDGRWLYFVSDRPAYPGDPGSDGDIWRVGLDQGEPVRLGINSDAQEYSPVVVASGALYFASAREGGDGQGDIYRAAPAADGFQPASGLGPAINSATGEWNLWVSTNEQEMIFEASSRPTNLSIPGDLYYSRHNGSGWLPAVPLTRVNSRDSDLLPRVHSGRLYYTTAPIGGHARIIAVSWPEARPALSN